MIFGRHINRYYLKYLHLILGGVIALVLVDFFQLEIPKLYQRVIDGSKQYKDVPYIAVPLVSSSARKYMPSSALNYVGYDHRSILMASVFLRIGYQG